MTDEHHKNLPRALLPLCPSLKLTRKPRLVYHISMDQTKANDSGKAKLNPLKCLRTPFKRRDKANN